MPIAQTILGQLSPLARANDTPAMFSIELKIRFRAVSFSENSLQEPSLVSEACDLVAISVIPFTGENLIGG